MQRCQPLKFFGPVVCIYEYDRLEDAIAQANKLRFSFQAAVFTQSIKHGFDVAKALKARSVMINDHTAFRVDWMPFGGSLDSRDWNRWNSLHHERTL